MKSINQFLDWLAKLVLPDAHKVHQEIKTVGLPLIATNTVAADIAANRSLQRIQRLRQHIRMHPKADTSAHLNELHKRIKELQHLGVPIPMNEEDV